LGKEFTGSTLFFKGFPGKPNKESIQIEYPYFFKYFLILFYYFLLFRYLFYYCYYLIKIRYNHTVGMALIHAGRHIHGVNKLITGERSNLILWCRSSHYRSLLKQQ
jgi:hypothetical protein